MPPTSSPKSSGISGPKSASNKSLLIDKARELGFARVGIAPATDADGFAAFESWLDAGYAGTMSYLENRREARRHPRGVMPGVKSVVMLAYDYGPGSWHDADMTPRCRVASYAEREDYHPRLWGKLKSLRDWLAATVPGTLSRGITDTAPLLERDFARRAGLGWVGKNTMLLNKEVGSFFLLAGLLTSLELEPDVPHTANHCGTCTRCLQACPTQAFASPGVLDARKCISYLTIELKTAMPLELRDSVGDWLLGCDVCQDVCPWNRHAAANPDFPRDERLIDIDPVELLRMTEVQVAARFRGTPLADRGRAGKVRRNAAIVLGNRGGVGAVDALRLAAGDADEVMAEAARWALAKCEATAESQPALTNPALL